MPISIINISISNSPKETTIKGLDTDTSEIIEKTVSSYGMVNLHPLVDHLYSFKPVQNNSDNKYSFISIEIGVEAIYTPLDSSQSWSVQYINIKEYFIQNLIEEVILTP